MKITRPPGVLAGFMAFEAFEEVPELIHAGEQWVPRHFPIPTHSHEHWELYLQASGESVWHSEGALLKIPTNAMYIAPPGIEHSIAEYQPAKHHFFFAAVDVEAVLRKLSGMPEGWPNHKVMVIEEASSLAAPFRLLIREVSLDLPYRAAGIRAALDALIIETSRLIADRERSAEHVTAYAHPSVTHAKQLIEHHLSSEWKISDLARIVGMSPSHLADSFTRDVGVSPHRYLVEQRIAAAEEYLKTSELPITEIALELGFSSGQYFATVFKRLRGISPREVRSGSE